MDKKQTSFRSPEHKKTNDVLFFTQDDDFDDFFELYGIYKVPKYRTRYQLKKNVETMNYRIMNHILLECAIQNDPTHSEMIQDFLEYAESHDEYTSSKSRSPLHQQAMNIQYLYNILNDWKLSAHSFGISLPIYIYRGWRINYSNYFDAFKSDQGNLLKDIKMNDTVTVPTFISTTIDRNTALRFTAPNYYLWEIIVPIDKLHMFQYVYLGENIKLLDYDSYSESEILLNVGTKLRFIESKKETGISYISDIQGKQSMNEVNYILQRFEFIGYQRDVSFDLLGSCIEGDVSEMSHKSHKKIKAGKKTKQKTKQKTKHKRKTKKRKRKTNKKKKGSVRKKKIYHKKY